MGRAASTLTFEKKTKGQVLTPAPIANFLADWAITKADGRVLDLGAGEGVFLSAAWRKLRSLGAGHPHRTLYGVEKDPDTLAECQRQLSELGIASDHLLHGDFLDISLPTFDAVIGNPPYVRRMFLEEETVSRLAGERGRRLTDLCCYFLLRAMDLLADGGRLGVIVSASWLDMDYGAKLKQRLLGEFSIRLLVGFEGMVFPDALVKPVILLAEKRKATAPAKSRLGLWPADFSLDELPNALRNHAHVHEIPQAALAADAAWSPLLRAPMAEELLSRWPLAQLNTIAESRIGLQTFAKPFYIVSRARANRLAIEKEFLAPIAVSPRDFASPLLTQEAIRHFVFYCSLPKSRLEGTQALWYIRNAEEQTVPVRGKAHAVKGYANAPRLARACRKPWYNIRSEIDRRGHWPVLFPRRIFRSYLALENMCGAVANEDFLEIRPYDLDLTSMLLAWLNSSWGELVIRQRAHLYGGGVFNLNPGQLPSLPIPDLVRMSNASRQEFRYAWFEFSRTEPNDSDKERTRRKLDAAVGAALRADVQSVMRVQELAKTLRRLAEQASRPHRSGGWPLICPREGPIDARR
jgi:hypothetical protein